MTVAILALASPAWPGGLRIVAGLRLTTGDVRWLERMCVAAELPGDAWQIPPPNPGIRAGRRGTESSGPR